MLSKQQAKCPGCGIDVREGGIRCEGTYSTTWLKIGASLMQVATAQREQDKAYCLQCGKALLVKPVDLMRAA